METRSDFFEKIMDQNQQVSNLNFKILQDFDTMTHYKEFISPRELDLFNIADMTPMTKKQFKSALVDLSLVY